MFNYSFPIFLKWRLAHACKFHSLCQDQSTVAQLKRVMVLELPMIQTVHWDGNVRGKVSEKWSQRRGGLRSGWSFFGGSTLCLHNLNHRECTELSTHNKPSHKFYCRSIMCRKWLMAGCCQLSNALSADVFKNLNQNWTLFFFFCQFA